MTETDEYSGFVVQVRDALTHLHDPSHLLRSPLARFAHHGSSSSPLALGSALRQAFLDAVEALRSGANLAASRHDSRAYQILKLRYVEALDISQVLQRLALSRSLYYLELDRAVDALAALLWENWDLGRAAEFPVQAREQASRFPDARQSVGERRPGAVTRRPALTNLPAQLTSFVGREREMAEVTRLLGTTRLLTLTGTGGCGKTRLAAEAARPLVDAYPDGVWIAQLAPIADPALVPLTVAANLGLEERADEPIMATLLRHLRARHALLVLDNCEHLLDPVARLAESLLEACRDLSILATSRQPLGIGGESTLRVPSLSSPPSAEGSAREALLQAVLGHDATRLFVDRARSALPSFEPSPANASAIGEICRRLDGIPLAIELAAARVRALSPDQITSRLDHDFHLLTGGSRTALPRQQTLKATLDWSYNLLSGPERILLRRLSVFAGGFTLGAAEGVATGDGIEEIEVVSLLAQLVDKSLVEADARQGDARYRLLEPVRQYAWHRLEESGKTEEIQRRHATWLTRYVAMAEAEFFGPQEASWLIRVAPENDNVRAALAWYLDHDPTMGLLLAGRIWTFWTYQGVRSERQRWLDGMLARAPEPTHARAAALSSAAYEAFDEGDYDRATALASDSLSIWLEVREIEAGLELNVLIVVAAEQGDHDRALILLEQAEVLGRKHGYAKSLAQTLTYGGYEAWLAGDYLRSRSLLADALSAWRAIGSLWGIGTTLVMLGNLTSSEGDYPSARTHFDEGLETLRTIWHVPNVGTGLITLGYVSLCEGDHSRARRDLSEALRFVAPRAYRPRISRCLTFLALLASREDDAARVAKLVGSAEGVNPYYRHMLAPNEASDLDACLADARAALGDEAFSRAWAEGHAMSLAQAVEYALRDEHEA